MVVVPTPVVGVVTAMLSPASIAGETVPTCGAAAIPTSGIVATGAFGPAILPPLACIASEAIAFAAVPLRAARTRVVPTTVKTLTATRPAETLTVARPVEPLAVAARLVPIGAGTRGVATETVAAAPIRTLVTTGTRSTPRPFRSLLTVAAAPPRAVTAISSRGDPSAITVAPGTSTVAPGTSRLVGAACMSALATLTVTSPRCAGFVVALATSTVL
ncbi:hypothetical protein JSY14_11830 [Brachybacterium sp. EF45031]|uniref:hypothetical protein n=1 Tax=Brachybacterium sillae TaxID=2810536 RepID=UPI00217E870D|nr:hypothetical protein [Brachybacterium sillae]MCS6712673.1 hypothetical protein [Brachybacterium sillae]